MRKRELVNGDIIRVNQDLGLAFPYSGAQGVVFEAKLDEAWVMIHGLIKDYPALLPRYALTVIPCSKPAEIEARNEGN